jgi:hypothetical protein
MPPWTDEEIVLAMEFFVTCPERMHTDSRAKCQEISAQVSHTAGALDQILRNIKSAYTGHTGLPHASQRIRQLVDQYRNDIPGLRARAAEVRTEMGLPPLDCGH